MPARGETGGTGRACATAMGRWVDSGERQAVGRWVDNGERQAVGRGVDSGEGAAGSGEVATGGGEVGRQRCRYVVVGGVAHSNHSKLVKRRSHYLTIF